MIENNIIINTDAYKVSHYNLYPPKTEKIYSYFESRGGQFNEIVFFGLQYYIKKYLEGQVVSREKIEQAAEFWAECFGSDSVFNRAGWEYILNKHNGRLPVHIRAVPEGMVTPVHNVLMTIENTDPECYWLTNWLETLLVQVWYGCTVATQSRYMKGVLKHYLEETGTPEDIAFKLHDFGFRGVSSVESAMVGGAAHLVNFMGTDTMAGAVMLKNYYGAKSPFFGSIPATEHSTITSWGKENESGAVRNMLEKYPSGTIACVGDSFNIYEHAGDILGKQVKDSICGRDGVWVCRPDSGSPSEVLPRLLEILSDTFGHTVNNKGYKVLHPKIRIIQGDGINVKSFENILSVLANLGHSADNLAFGSGGGLLQQLNRDTCKFAFKCSSVKIDGVWRDVFKDPVTDSGKRSKRGKLNLTVVGGQYRTVSSPCPSGLLRTVFYNGRIFNPTDLEQIRGLAEL